MTILQVAKLKQSFHSLETTDIFIATEMQSSIRKQYLF